MTLVDAKNRRLEHYTSQVDECDSNTLWCLGESCNLVRESKMFVKDKAEVSSRVGGVLSEELCMYFGKLVLRLMSKNSKNSVLEKFVFLLFFVKFVRLSHFIKELLT